MEFDRAKIFGYTVWRIMDNLEWRAVFTYVVTLNRIEQEHPRNQLHLLITRTNTFFFIVDSPNATIIISVLLGHLILFFTQNVKQIL